MTKSSSESKSTDGMGFFPLLLLIFITLKLCGVIAWSWVWVLAPFWIPLALGSSLLFFGVLYLAASDHDPRKTRR